MAIAFVADGGWAAASVGNIVATVPAVSSGNMMVAFIRMDSQLSGITITTPSGWTLIDAPASATQSPYFMVVGAYYRIATSSEPATYTFTGTNNTGTGSGGVGNIRAFSGTDTVSPINSFADGVDTTGATIIIPSLQSETFVKGEWGVYFNANGGGATFTSNTPSIFVNIVTGQNNKTYWLGTFAKTQAPGAQTFNWAGGFVLQGIGFTMRPFVQLMSQAWL